MKMFLIFFFFFFIISKLWMNLGVYNAINNFNYLDYILNFFQNNLCILILFFIVFCLFFNLYTKLKKRQNTIKNNIIKKNQKRYRSISRKKKLIKHSPTFITAEHAKDIKEIEDLEKIYNEKLKDIEEINLKSFENKSTKEYFKLKFKVFFLKRIYRMFLFILKYDKKLHGG